MFNICSLSLSLGVIHFIQAEFAVSSLTFMYPTRGHNTQFPKNDAQKPRTRQHRRRRLVRSNPRPCRFVDAFGTSNEKYAFEKKWTSNSQTHWVSLKSKQSQMSFHPQMSDVHCRDFKILFVCHRRAVLWKTCWELKTPLHHDSTCSVQAWQVPWWPRYGWWTEGRCVLKCFVTEVERWNHITFIWLESLVAIKISLALGQLMSIDVNWCQLMSGDVNWCQLMSIDVNWCQLMSIDVNWICLSPSNYQSSGSNLKWKTMTSGVHLGHPNSSSALKKSPRSAICGS